MCYGLVGFGASLHRVWSLRKKAAPSSGLLETLPIMGTGKPRATPRAWRQLAGARDWEKTVAVVAVAEQSNGCSGSCSHLCQSEEYCVIVDNGRRCNVMLEVM